MTSATPIRVGLYGLNGHQIHAHLVGHSHARLVAIAGFSRESLPEALRDDPTIRVHQDLASLLNDDAVQLVSLCSPLRRDQAGHAIATMEAGKHVYAEKPCAISEAELDSIIEAADRTGMKFREMAGTAFEEPYRTMREIVAAGTLGTVIQVYAQKSYPWHDKRPADEAVDGGLIAQNAIHAVRFVEHVAAVRVADVVAQDTTLGDPAGSGGRMASTLMMRLENGGLATIVANYLNPRGIGRWGNEELRIWGTDGMLESTDGGTRTRLVVGQQDRGPVPTGRSLDYFDLMVDELRGAGTMPLTLEAELHPTRVVIRARASAHGCCPVKYDGLLSVNPLAQRE